MAWNTLICQSKEAKDKKIVFYRSPTKSTGKTLGTKNCEDCILMSIIQA